MRARSSVPPNFASLAHPCRAQVGVILAEFQQRGFRGIDQRMRTPEMLLMLVVLAAQCEGRKIGRFLRAELLVNVDGAARGPDDYRGGLAHQKRRQASMIERILQAGDAPMRRDFIGQSARRRAILGNDDFLLDEDALGAGTLHSEHLPVIDDGVFAGLEQQQDLLRRFAWHHSRSDKMGPDITSGSVVPEALDLVAVIRALDDYGGAGRGRAEVAVGAVSVDLCSLAEAGQDNRMAGGERQNPSARRASACDLDHRAMKCRHIAFIAAEASRLDHAIKSRLDELLVGRGQNAPCSFAFGLALAQHPAHLASARDYRLGREAGFRNPDRTRHDNELLARNQRWLQGPFAFELGGCCLGSHQR